MSEANIQRGCCSDLQRLEISRKIREDEVKLLAFHLGVSDNEVDEIEDRKGRRRHDVVFEILNTWIQSKGSEATQKKLIQTLYRIHRTDIVDAVFSGREILQGKTELSNPVIKSIQDRQKEYYRNVQLPRILWLQKKYLPLKELYVELTLKKKDKMGRETMESIALEDMFQMEEEKEDRRPRIFIEGHPGFGKTTLLLKILSDWSRKQNYVCGSFYLAFLIPLRSFSGHLEIHFYHQCLRTINTKEEVSQIIKSIEGKVLILLDGWDEATEETKTALVPLLKGLVYRNTTVVVTSRTGFHDWPQEKDDPLNIIGSGGYEQYKFWDKRIQVKGILRARRTEFLRKYLEIGPTDLDRTIEKLPVRFDDFYRCPLFLLLLGALIKENKFEEKKIETKTQLYKTVFNFIVTRSLVRNRKLKEDQDIDIFDPHNSQSSFYRDVVIGFGRLCLQKLKAQDLSFERSDVIFRGVDLYDLGFLTKIILFAKDEETPVFEPIHKSFLEFLAAFYLSTIHEPELAKEVKELFKVRMIPTSDQLVYQFLCGLLDSDAAKFFRSLLPFKDSVRLLDIKHDFRCTLEPLLKEIANSNEEMYKSLVHFVPKYLIDANDDVQEDFPPVEYAERWIGPVVKLTSEIQIMKEFILTEKSLERIRVLNCLKPFRINKIILYTNEITKLAETNSEFKCRNLVIQYWPENPWTSFASILERLSKFCFWDILSLEFYFPDPDEFVKICKEILNGGLNNVNIEQLSVSGIEIDKFRFISSSIADLLKAKIVTVGIKLSFMNRNESKFDQFAFEDIFNLHVSGHILSLSLDFSNVSSNSYPIVLPSAIYKSQRQWKYLELYGNFIKPETDEDIIHTTINDFNSIVFTSVSETLFSHVLSKCDDIKKLSCSDIERIQGDDLICWKGFDTIQTLVLNSQHIENAFPSLVSRFQNLKKLKINDLCIPSDKNTRESIFDALLKTISSLPHLNTLSIECKDGLVLYQFLEGLSCLTDKEKMKIPLKKLILNSCTVNPFPMNEIIEQYKWITRHKKDIPKELTMIQREQYKRYVRIPCFTWLEGGAPIDTFILKLESEDLIKDGEITKPQSINVENLFDRNIHRILVKGSSQAENKVFCCRILSDWVKNKIHGMFGLLFHIEANDFVSGGSVEEVFIEKFPGDTISKNDILACITAYQDRILLILEGCDDELSEETKSVIESLLLGRLFPNMSILVTCNNRSSFPNKYFAPAVSKQTSENGEEIKTCFDRRVVIKLVDLSPSNKLPEGNWLNMRSRLMNKMSSMNEQWATAIFNCCPVFLTSMCLMITKECNTRNYKNYFNFLFNKLFNADKQVDLFSLQTLNAPLSCEYKALHVLNSFGEYALQKMTKKESVNMNDNDIIVNLGDESILRFGILVKTAEVYEPIHDSFSAFLAAFSVFNVLRVSGEEDFKREIQRILFREELLPTEENSLFFSFLGGFLNDRATLLFEALLHFAGWFNLQSESFIKILMEIVDIYPFFESFRGHLLRSFCPPLYDIRKLQNEYLSTSIHSHLINAALDSNVIETLSTPYFKLIPVKENVTFNHLVLHPYRFREFNKTDELNFLKYQTLSVWFYGTLTNIENWSAFVSVLESMQKEKNCFYVKTSYKDTNTSFLNCLHKELTEGQLREKTIHRVLLTIRQDDDPRCLRKLVDLVRNNKIKEAVFVKILKSDRNEELKTAMASDLQELFDSIVQSGSISEFLISNADTGLSPVFDFTRLREEQNYTFNSVYLHGCVNALIGDEKSNPTIEEALILCKEDDRLVESLRGIKWLWCRMKCFDCLVEDQWQHLNELEELTLTIEESIEVNPSVSKLIQLRVLTLTFSDIEQIPNGLDVFLHELLSSLSLRILQLIDIPYSIPHFNLIVGCIVKGFDGDKENSLDELLLCFSGIDKHFNWYELKESKGMKEVQYLLQENLIGQLSLVDSLRGPFLHISPPFIGDVPRLRLPLGHQFIIKQVVHGSNSSHSRHSQWEYRWMEPVIKHCITSNRDYLLLGSEQIQCGGDDYSFQSKFSAALNWVRRLFLSIVYFVEEYY